MNVKEFDNFFLAIDWPFAHFSFKFRQNCEFCSSVQNAKFPNFVHFQSKTILLSA